MISSEIWFSSSEEEMEDDQSHVEVARKRRILRDSLNPFDLPDRM